MAATSFSRRTTLTTFVRERVSPRASVREPTWIIANDRPDFPPLRVVLLNVDGGESPGLHEAIGLESVAGSVIRTEPATDVIVGDLQFDLLRNDLDLDRIIREIVGFVAGSTCPVIVGLGIPIYSWDNAKAIIVGVHEALRTGHKNLTVHWLLGNALATYTRSELLRRELPVPVTIVRGDGERAMAQVVATVLKPDNLPETVDIGLLDAQEHRAPLRLFTRAVHERGGVPKIEASRGCDWGHCTFCSRCGQRGTDYRSFAAGLVVEQMREVVAKIGPCAFDFTDEEAFADPAATAGLVCALEEAALPLSFMASLRVGTLLDRNRDGLLGRLAAVGLVKVFLGVEGGSDDYLKLLAKGQRIHEVDEAMQVVSDLGIDTEMGFITFSWRMTYPMLVGNTDFLRRYYPYVSSVFNNLRVRAGTVDETMLRQYVRRGTLGDYDPDANFSVNESSYLGVPFLHDDVARAWDRAVEFADDLRPQYAMKNLVRVRSLPEVQRATVTGAYNGLHELHFRALDDIVNRDGAHLSDLRAERVAMLADTARACAGIAARNEQARMMVQEIDDYVRR